MRLLLKKIGKTWKLCKGKEQITINDEDLKDLIGIAEFKKEFHILIKGEVIPEWFFKLEKINKNFTYQENGFAALKTHRRLIYPVPFRDDMWVMMNQTTGELREFTSFEELLKVVKGMTNGKA